MNFVNLLNQCFLSKQVKKIDSWGKIKKSFQRKDFFMAVNLGVLSVKFDA